MYKNLQTYKTRRALHGLTQGFGWAGFGLNIAASTGHTWLHTPSGPEGLYSRCNVTSLDLVCERIPVGEAPHLDACRALLIISAIFNASGCSFFTTGVTRFCKLQAIAGVVCFYLAVIVTAIGMGVYTAGKAGTCDTTWGHTYGLGWGAVGLVNLAGGFACTSVYLWPDDTTSA